MGANGGAVDAVMATVRHDLGQRHGNGLPDPSFTPSPEPAIDGVPAAIFGWHVTPWSTAAEPPEDTVDDGAVLFGPPASTSVRRVYRQQVPQNAPFRFAQIAPAQVCLQKAALNQSSRASSIVLIAGSCRDRPILRLCLHGGFYGFGGSV